MYTIEGKVYSAKAAAALVEGTLVKLDSTEGQVAQATAATDEVF